MNICNYTLRIFWDKYYITNNFPYTGLYILYNNLTNITFWLHLHIIPYFGLNL